VAEGLSNISLFITREDYRGRGLGRRLLERVLEERKEQNIVLSSVWGARSLYKSHGFECSSRQVSVIEVHNPKPVSPPDASVQVVRVTSESLEEVAEFDERVVGFNRSEYLQQWLLADHCNSYAAFVAGRCEGYASFRPHPNWTRVQPMFATSPSIVMQLFKPIFFGGELDPKPLKMMVLNADSQHDFIQKLHAMGDVDVKQKPEHQMFTKNALHHDEDKIYAVTNSETTVI
jgi:predicted GNAT family acetyltransferase